MNIYFRLAAGRYSMKQADIFLPERLYYLIICLLLKLIQSIHFDNLFLLFIQPTDFMIINLENLLVHQTVQYGRSHISPLQQLFLGDFFRSTVSQNARTLYIFHEKRQLLRSTGEYIKQNMKPLLVGCSGKGVPVLLSWVYKCVATLPLRKSLLYRARI